MVADVEMDMAPDMQVDMVADMAADKKTKNEVDVCTKTKTKWIGPKLFDAKSTRLVCLLSFREFIYQYSDFHQNITQMSLYISCWLIDLAHTFLDMEPPNMSTNNWEKSGEQEI